VDFDAGARRIKRVQDKQTGKLVEATKTASVIESYRRARRCAECSPIGSQPVLRSTEYSPRRNAACCSIPVSFIEFGGPRSNEWDSR
jgi:hypothetical protein